MEREKCAKYRHVSKETYCTAAVSLCILTLNHFSASCWERWKHKLSRVDPTQHGANIAMEQRHEAKNRSLIMSAEMEHHYITAWWEMPFCIRSKYRQRLDQCLALKWFMLRECNRSPKQKDIMPLSVNGIHSWCSSDEQGRQKTTQNASSAVSQPSNFSIQFKQLLLLSLSCCHSFQFDLFILSLFFSFTQVFQLLFHHIPPRVPTILEGRPKRWWQQEGWIVEITC